MNFLKRLVRHIVYRCLGRVEIELLVKRGLKLGKNVFIDNDALIDPSYPWLISIGDDSFITTKCVILAHDASTWHYTGYYKVGRVCIGKRTFIGAGSVVLPGVTIGDNVVIGAGSVVTRDIPDNVVAAGNPAAVISSIQDFAERHKKNLQSRPHYPKAGWTLNGGITEKNKQVMLRALEDGIGYTG
ncbi:MAG TPA: acyltransferase [Syntrophomonadaceae bacterium]|nr:acyltransferase [Syntrophomonadaceae bacterium]